MKSRILSFFVFAFLFSSCDLLRSSPYEVEAWTPGEGFHHDPGKLKISLLLSRDSDRARTEQAFSLTEDRRSLKGDFAWQDRRLFFLPATPLESGRNYVITLGTGAQDKKGVSLEGKFEVSFTTRPPGERPRISGTEPPHEGSISESRGAFRLFFTAEVSLDSCADHVSFSPSTPGSWRLEDGNKTACFVPREPWQPGGLYRLRVSGDFRAASGSVLGTEHSSVFTIGKDREKPALLSAFAVFRDGVTGVVHYEEEIFFEEPGQPASSSVWERSTALRLVFSEPVDTGGVKSLLVVEPPLALVSESPPGMSCSAVYRPAEYPEWGSSFLFRLTPGVKDGAGNESENEYAFRIACAGPLSKPPALAGIRLPMAPGNAVDREALSFSRGDLFADLPVKSGADHYPFGERTSTWIELYFETAPGADIDLFSVMELFSVESTNQALSFSPRSVRTEGFFWPDPMDGWEAFTRVELRGVLSNTVNSGIVTFRVAPGLADTRGNSSSVDFRISVLK